MTPLRAHNRLVLKSDTLLVLTSSGSIRLIFLLLIAVFGAALVFGFDPARDLAGSRLFGTIIFGIVMLVLLGVVAWAKEVRFDRAKALVETVYRVFGFQVKQDPSIPFYEIRSVVLQKVTLLKDTDVPMKKSGTLGGLIEARSQLFRLFLDTGDGRLKLDESNFREQLAGCAKMMSEFIGVALISDEI